MLTAPSIFQYTFLAWVPFINFTLEYVLVVKAPFIFIINTAFEFPKASR